MSKFRGAFRGAVSRCLRCLCYLRLSDPVEEGHDLAAGAVVIDAELRFHVFVMANAQQLL